MKKFRLTKGLYGGAAILVITIIIIVIFYKQPISSTTTSEVAVAIGEPYSQMIKDSTPGVIESHPYSLKWGYYYVNKPARLYFKDPQYSFTTPVAAKDFFVVAYMDGNIETIRISPQLDTLSLDDAMKVILDLQEQWRKKGWILSKSTHSSAYEDTPEMREKAKNNKCPTVFWNADNKYQLMIFLQKLADPKRPSQDRYLIIINITVPVFK